MWEQLKIFFLSVLTGGESFIMNFLISGAKAIESSGGALLITAAQQAVSAAEAQGGTAQEKFDAAKAGVIGTLESAGITVLINAVHVAIESAVANMKTAGT